MFQYSRREICTPGVEADLTRKRQAIHDGPFRGASTVGHVDTSLLSHARVTPVRNAERSSSAMKQVSGFPTSAFFGTRNKAHAASFA